MTLGISFPILNMFDLVILCSHFFEMTGRYEEAVKDLRQALRIDPNFEDGRQNLEQAIQDWNLNPK